MTLQAGFAFALCAQLALLTACNRAHAPESPLPEAETRRFRACTSALECVYIHNGCCDCANGGQDLAVNAAQLAAFRAQFRCSGCTERGGTCGVGTLACEQQLCVFHR